MADDTLTSMLERATADPPDGYAAALLRRTAAAPLTGAVPTAEPMAVPQSAEPYVLEHHPLRWRRPLLVGVAAAAVATVVAAAVLTVGNDDVAAPAATPDGLAVVVDGERVPADDLGTASERALAYAERRRLTEAERPELAAATILFERFLAELGRAEGEPVTEAQIDWTIDEAHSIEVQGQAGAVDPTDAKLRAAVRTSLEAGRGMAVLRERFGVPPANADAEAWRGWFAEQLDAHDARVTVDGQVVPSADLVAVLPLFQPA